MNNQINSPNHYKVGNIEVIEIIRECTPKALSPYEGGLYFNIVKYVLRSGNKGALTTDLKKARYYLDELIKELEEENERG